MSRNIRVVMTTSGSTTALGALARPYRYKGREGWRPEDVTFREAGTRRPGPPADAWNSPEAKAARMALFTAARRAGKGVREAGRTAGIAPKTASVYERERLAAEAVDAP